MLRDRPALVFALIFAAMIATPMMPSTFWERMATITDADAEQTGSRQQRIQLLRQGMQVFAENPVTGIGAGQFVNYDGAMMVERWRDTHNVWLQVAAELGIFGLCAFGFLVWRAFSSCLATMRMIRGPTRARFGSGQGSRRGSDQSRQRAPAADLTPEDRRILEMNARGMFAGMVGWFVCALFASVAFNWTFYYVFALAVAGREIARARLGAPQSTPQESAASVPAAAMQRRYAG
jgi:O-antigen ligase